MEHAGFEPASWLFPMGVKANRNQNVPLGGTVSGVKPLKQFRCMLTRMSSVGRRLSVLMIARQTLTCIPAMQKNKQKIPVQNTGKAETK